MIPLGVVTALWMLATGTGALLALPLARAGLCRRETLLYASAFGLGLVAYAVFALGLAGRFTTQWMLGLGLTLAPFSVIGWLRLVRLRPSRGSDTRSEPTATWVSVAAAMILAITLATALVACFMPPGAHEWDSLSYHLAVPKAFLSAGRIVELPTDHHSYFPFLVQMLFAVGLAFDGYAAAKLVHLMFGILSLAATYALVARAMPKWAAWLATLTIGLAPMAVWEAGIAYIELAQAFYVTLAIHALMRLMETRTARDAATCGAVSGLALSVKTLSLIPLVGMACIALWKTRGLRGPALIAVIALIVGSPFYLRTWLLTGNPVYPFAFSIFGGKNWDAERSRLYATEHTSFGLNARLPSLADDLRPSRSPYVSPSPADRLRNMALAPFMLVAAPRMFHNYNDPSVHATLGFLWLALIPLCLLWPRSGPDLSAPAVLLVFWYVLWSFSMQYMRYLIPALPIAAFIGAAGAVRLASRSRPLRAALFAILALQAATLWAHAIPRAAENLVLLRSPERLEREIARQVNVYAAQIALNNLTEKKHGVVLFEETRGYYLDRPVLWGNSPHSAYIPYETFDNAADMAEWFAARGFPYALVNLQFAPQASTQQGASELREAVRANTESVLMQRWYGDAASGSEPWRRLIGDAIREGDAMVIHEATMNGAVVVRFISPKGTAP